MDKLMMFNQSASRLEPEWLDVMNFSARLSCSIVGIVSNVITIFVICRMALKMSRMDKMIAVLSINNLLFLINSIVQQFVMRDAAASRTTSSLLMNYELTLFMSCVAAILIMLSNYMLTTDEISDVGLISVFYVIFVIGLAAETVLCFHGVGNRYFGLAVQFFFFVSVGVLIRNEAVICWKLYNKEALCPPLGITIARIFDYNILITIILFAIFNPNPVLILIRATTFINSLYIMIYLIYSNIHFRSALLNSVKCRSTKISSNILDEEDTITMDD